MKLHDICETLNTLELPARGEAAHPELSTIQLARAAITRGVLDDDFLADCLGAELDLIAVDRPRRGLVPFFTMPEFGVRFAFGYWPPGGTPGPHEHTAWTITAVCRNQLEVLTYDRTESYRRGTLISKRCFDASAGKVGYIYEPCIHEPRNITSDWSLSLHVISPRDGEPLNEPYPPLAALSDPLAASAHDEHPYARVVAARQREASLLQVSRIVAAMTVIDRSALLARCHALGAAATRALVGRLAPEIAHAAGLASLGRLERIHRDLVLTWRAEGGAVRLYAQTPAGLREELTINDVARGAIACAAREVSFDIQDLPGPLSLDERALIGEGLEHTGIFRRVAP